jgi:tetracycline resistance efflux pump
MTEPSWVSLVPPLLAIVLAIASRQVYLSLGAGIWAGWTILSGWHPATGIATAIDGTVAVLGDPGNARVILFTLAIGSLIATIEASGGVRGFVDRLERGNFVNTPLRAQALPYLVGIIIFIESNITVLVAGAIGRPLFDRYRISREKLAYIVDSTSAPVCMLIPLNAWGAYILGILTSLGVSDPLRIFVEAIPLNFYALGAVLMTGIAIFAGIDFGPMKVAQQRAATGKVLRDGAVPMVDTDVLAPAPNDRIPPRARNMFVPIAAMVLMMPIGLFITGHGDPRAGNGSTSVLWAVLFGLTVSWIMLLWQKAFTLDELVRHALKGAGGLISMALVLLLALSLADVANRLGTGAYVAQVTSGVLPPMLFLPVIFLVSAFVAFSTGTSWGTFAIMLPIAVPAATTLGLPLAPFVAAALSGGVFGDHASPISDTTIISSMASATDHIDHVRTQLPYALLVAVIAAFAFAIVGASL